MNHPFYLYTFHRGVPLEEVEHSLLLATLATEAVYGRSRVRLDASFILDEEERACLVDGSTRVGNHIAQVFTEFLTREFGEDAFAVERVAAEEEECVAKRNKGASPGRMIH